MADKFTIDGVDYELTRQFDLGGSLGRFRGNQILRLDSGRREIFTRQIPERTISLRLLNASRQDRALVERFFWDIAQGARRTFSLTLTGAWREVIQCGATINGQPILCGATVDGEVIKCGQWITADSYTYHRCRFVEDSLIVADSLDHHADLEFALVQELEP